LLWCFDPIPYHGLHLWDYAITFIGQAIHGMVPLDEWSARRRRLCQHTTVTTDKHFPAEIRSHNPTNERPLAHALDRAPTGIDKKLELGHLIHMWRIVKREALSYSQMIANQSLNTAK